MKRVVMVLAMFELFGDGIRYLYIYYTSSFIDTFSNLLYISVILL
jgi:hypothetical protein